MRSPPYRRASLRGSFLAAQACHSLAKMVCQLKQADRRYLRTDSPKRLNRRPGVDSRVTAAADCLLHVWPWREIDHPRIRQ